jgi:tetratricopeptide (TPR) repeat protein
MRNPLLLSASVLPLLLLSLPVPLHPQTGAASGPTQATLRDLAHASSDWQLIAPHLPDPATASPQTLETQGDLLRVRRFPEDALDYYNYALARGGDAADLFNKIGITQMELGNPTVAKTYFEHALKLRQRDPQAWNNLGAVEFMQRNYSSATRDYKRAIKLDRRFAVSHSNLGLVYVEQKDFASAKKEMVLALRLDPTIFQRSSAAGVSLHMLSAADHANFCFQMAKVYARMGNEPEMLHQLQTAAEAGMNVSYEMTRDSDLAKYVRDPRVTQLLLEAKSFRDAKAARSTVAAELPPAASPSEVAR